MTSWSCRFPATTETAARTGYSVFSDHPSVTLLPITSHLIDAPLLRIDIGPGGGLDRPSQIQIDKPQTARRERIGAIVGRADPATVTAVNRSLAVFLGLV